MPEALAAQVAALGPAFTGADGTTVAADIVLRAVVAWTQLLGMVSFELFGRFARAFEPADELFEHAVSAMMGSVGL